MHMLRESHRCPLTDPHRPRIESGSPHTVGREAFHVTKKSSASEAYTELYGERWQKLSTREDRTAGKRQLGL